MASEEVKRGISDLMAKYKDLFDARKVQELSHLFTEDCIIMPPGEPAFQGRAEYAKFAKKYHTLGTVRLSYETDNIISLENGFAITCGKSMMDDGKGGQESTFKFLIVNKMVDDKWLVHIEIWNSDDK